MSTLKKLLYITDQDEYVDHSFIAPLFEIYLKKYISIDIVYFTEFKSDFERKDAHHFTVPSRYKNILLEELNRNNVNIAGYDFIMVRNNINIMELVLKFRDTYQYKALYRFSCPKRSMKLSYDKAENKDHLLSDMMDHFKTKNETDIINSCDAFLPTSHAMHKAFLPEVKIKTIICSPAINATMLHKNKQHNEEEKRFVYVGTLDKVREFETVLAAFSNLKNDQWKLTIATRDMPYAAGMLENYPQIRASVELCNAQTKDELLDLIAKADIGVALLPDIPIYNSSTPVKIFDYYSSAVPCLMSHSDHSSTIFTDSLDAWFCDFNQEDISKKIAYLLKLSKDDVAKVGEKGQQRLLEIRNYETIAKQIADQLEEL